MDIDHRPHTTTTTTTTTSTTSDLFVCFTSRFCSFSSMKLREPNKLSSSASLSRRLRASGSLKGGQSSPMLILTGTTTNKKRGYAFENPEPSSPKVTCIGQVRVKSRKSTKSTRSRGLCEAVRGLGADFNCLMPCLGGRSPCNAERGEDGRAGVKRTGSGNCGALFARWLMAVQDDEGGGVVGVGEVKKRGIDDGDDEVVVDCDVGFESVEKCEEEERVSVCVPPKNALLLMRCRSDPVRISALANRFVWEPSSPNEEEDTEEDGDGDGGRDEDEHDDGNVENRGVEREESESTENFIEDDDEQVAAKWVSSDEVENQVNEEIKSSGNAEYSVQADEAPVGEEEESEQPQQQIEQEEDLEVEEDEMIIVNWSLFESFYQFVETPETEHTEEVVESQNRVPEAESQISSSEVSTSEIPSTPPQQEESELNFSGDSTTENIENHTISDSETTHEYSVSETEHQQQQEQEKSSNVGLPDCLLSMLCEPKLSMEISKETWVCSRDFISHHNHQVNPINGSDHSNSTSQQVKEIDGSDYQKPNQQPSSSDQPPRSSFSSNHPTVPSAASSAVPSMAAVVMQKLVSAAVAHEPFVLTRCKSEPLRSSARLVPEACSWKNQNLQPHRRADLGLMAQPKC